MRHAERYEQIGLSFVAGYADTLSFIALSGLFTAHVTGDVILAAAQTTGGGTGRAVSNLTMIVIFMIVIFILAACTHARWWRNMPAAGRARMLLSLEAMLLSAFWVAGSVVSSRQGFPLRVPAEVIPVAGFGVAALAIQNALPSLLRIQRQPTTVMTGNLTRTTVDLALAGFSRLAGNALRSRQCAGRLGGTIPGICGFVIGAACAAPLTIWLHFNALALACVVLIATIPAATEAARTSAVA